MNINIFKYYKITSFYAMNKDLQKHLFMQWIKICKEVYLLFILIQLHDHSYKIKCLYMYIVNLDLALSLSMDCHPWTYM